MKIVQLDIIIIMNNIQIHYQMEMVFIKMKSNLHVLLVNEVIDLFMHKNHK